MKPGEIWKDEAGDHWKVMDARIRSGDGHRVFLSPVLRKRINVWKDGGYSNTVMEYSHDPARDRKYERTSEMLRWERMEQ